MPVPVPVPVPDSCVISGTGTGTGLRPGHGQICPDLLRSYLLSLVLERTGALPWPRSLPCRHRLRSTSLGPRGIMLFDNVLWSGRVADASDDEPDTKALREIPGYAAADDRVHAAVLTDADGLLLVTKRA